MIPLVTVSFLVMLSLSSSLLLISILRCVSQPKAVQRDCSFALLLNVLSILKCEKIVMTSKMFSLRFFLFHSFISTSTTASFFFDGFYFIIIKERDKLRLRYLYDNPKLLQGAPMIPALITNGKNP